MYFENNFPSEAPDYMMPDLAATYEQVAKRVAARMDKLEAALNICKGTMTSAQFAKVAKTVFDATGIEKFDAMSSDDLATAVKLLFDGSPVEPRIEFPDAEVIVDAAFLAVKEWETFRHLGIGGSDAAVIQGCSPYKTAYALYSDKVGIPQRDDEDAGARYARGHELEPKVIKAFCDLTGATAIEETRMFASVTFGMALADVDAIVRMKDGSLYVFEAKSTVKANIFNWRLGNSYVPPQYVVQCHQYPAVLGSADIKGTIIGCLFVEDTEVANQYVTSTYDVGNFLYRVIDRDYDKEAAILADDEEFFETYVLAHNPPEINRTLRARKASGTESGELADLKLLRLQNGDPTASKTPPVVKDEDLMDLTIQYLEMKEAIDKKKADFNAEMKTQEGQLAELKDSLLIAMGQEAVIRVPDEDEEGLVYEISNTLTSRVSTDTKLLREKYPDAYAECCSQGTTRFSIKPIDAATGKKWSKK